jgi:hypothetical protein
MCTVVTKRVSGKAAKWLDLQWVVPHCQLRLPFAVIVGRLQYGLSVVSSEEGRKSGAPLKTLRVKV